MRKIRPSLILFIIILTLATTYQFKSDTPVSEADPISHVLWDELLKKHVDNEGWVDYKEFMQDSSQLNDYLQLLLQNAPADDWEQHEKLAYWINAYNAFTVSLILKHYPVESIKDIGSAIQIPLINTPWDIKFIEYPDRKLDLNDIEHGIIRKDFAEPRIHFAVNCASFSCPKLRNEAYTGKRLDEQLQDQAIAFINDPEKNKISPEHAEVSKLFSWYRGDFKKEGTLIEFLNRYSKTKIKEGADIDYMDYDWSLNEK